MDKELIRPRDGSPVPCRECSGTLIPQGSISYHLKRHHGLTMAQYREKYGISKQSAHGRGKYWTGKRAVNRKYENLKTELSCHTCKKTFSVDTKWYKHRLKKGKTRFSCPSGIKGKRSDCQKKLQSLTIKEIRSTPESRQKTIRQLEERWSDPVNRKAYGDKMKAKPKAWHEKRMKAVLKANLSGKKTKLEIAVEAKLGENWKFVGDGTLMVGGLNPDFVHKDGKHLVEAFGCYWHGCRKCFPGSKAKGIPMNQRLSTFKKYGYSCRVLWEHDF